jgi:hypothetical protein
MATTTKIVRGRYFDGVTSATSGYVAKKINDITTGATTFQFSISKSGQELTCVITYT